MLRSRTTGPARRSCSRVSTRPTPGIRSTRPAGLCRRTWLLVDPPRGSLSAAGRVLPEPLGPARSSACAWSTCTRRSRGSTTNWAARSRPSSSDCGPIAASGGSGGRCSTPASCTNRRTARRRRSNRSLAVTGQPGGPASGCSCASSGDVPPLPQHALCAVHIAHVHTATGPPSPTQRSRPPARRSVAGDACRCGRLQEGRGAGPIGRGVARSDHRRINARGGRLVRLGTWGPKPPPAPSAEPTNSAPSAEPTNSA